MFPGKVNETIMNDVTPKTPVLRAEEYARLKQQARLEIRRKQSGQSVIIAIIVLFLLLFLAGIFIAILVGNINNAKRAEQTSTSQRFADAGIKYLDEQLTNAPEGADWRNIPTCLPDFNSATPYDVCNDEDDFDQPGRDDPDWNWIRPYNPETGLGGFTRVNFGSEVAGARNTGGRALVRVTYAPRLDPNDPESPLSRYIKLEVVGRTGQVIPTDPTTFGNTDALGQRVELVAYKAINLNEYVRQITNKDNRPVTVALGAQSPVLDNSTGGSPAQTPRNIQNIIAGPVRVNAGLTFYGVNRLSFNPLLNEGLEVAGPIRLNNISDSTVRLTNTDPTQVYIATNGLANNLNPARTSLRCFPRFAAKASRNAGRFPPKACWIRVANRRRY